MNNSKNSFVSYEESNLYLNALPTDSETSRVVISDSEPKHG